MIGLAFLVIALAWLAFSLFLAALLPKTWGVSKPVWRWALSAGLFLLLLVGPFVDHIVGMRQFHRLCDQETSLQVTSAFANTKRAKGLSSETTRLEGYAIQIERDMNPIIDMDTGEEIARYYRFRTEGGRMGGLLMLGGKYACAIDDRSHAEHKTLQKFEKQVNITYGVEK